MANRDETGSDGGTGEGVEGQKHRGRRSCPLATSTTKMIMMCERGLGGLGPRRQGTPEHGDPDEHNKTTHKTLSTYEAGCGTSTQTTTQRGKKPISLN